MYFMLVKYKRYIFVLNIYTIINAVHLSSAFSYMPTVLHMAEGESRLNNTLVHTEHW
jgi:hypothetical protein